MCDVKMFMFSYFQHVDQMFLFCHSGVWKSSFRKKTLYVDRYMNTYIHMYYTILTIYIQYI